MNTLTIDLVIDAVCGLLWLGAVVRVTRLITADAITDPVRAWAESHFGGESKWNYFLVCPWCVSIWVGIATAPGLLLYIDRDWRVFPVLGLVASWCAGVSALRLERDPDEEIEIAREQ